MKPPALGLLLGTRGASTYFSPRCDLPRGGPRGPLHPGQIFWACSKIFPSTQTEQNLGHFNILIFRSILSDCHAQQPSQPDCAQSAEHREHGIEAQADPRPFVGQIPQFAGQGCQG